MDILGVVLWLFMPVFAGYTVCRIFRWKETNQIETYLIGFFLLFLLQGLLFVPAVFLNLPYETAVHAVIIAKGVLLAVALLLFICSKIRKERGEKTQTIISKKERWYFLLFLVVFVLNIVRMVCNQPMLQEDITLETVKTTVATGTMFQYHPLTGALMDAGLINSKKIVTLPLFYSSIVSASGVDAGIFLSVVVGTQVLLASMFAAALIYHRVASVNRKKLYLFWFIYGIMVLSGDYSEYTLSYRLLHQGYLGETICFAVILPYLLYVVIAWYQTEGGEDKLTSLTRLKFVLKIMLALSASLFIEGLGTGFVILILCLFLATACCLMKSLKEVHACRES